MLLIVQVELVGALLVVCDPCYNTWPKLIQLVKISLDDFGQRFSFKREVELIEIWSHMLH